jgi:hypothetical protein
VGSELPELRYLRLDLMGQSMSGVEGFFDETVPKFGWSTPSSEQPSDSGVFTDLDSVEVKKVTLFSEPRDVRLVAYSHFTQLHLTGKVGNTVTFPKQSIGLIHTFELSIEDPPDEHDWQDLRTVISDTLANSLGSLRTISAAPVK